MKYRHRPPITLLILMALFFGASPSAAEKPLLQPGKSTLFERVLTRPGARLADKIGDIGSARNKLIPAFSRFYVYERTSVAGKDWLRIGADANGNSAGWVAKERTVAWRQQLTLALTNPGSIRDRLLFFDSKGSLEGVLKAPRPSDVTRPIIRTIEQGGTDDRIVALEPETFVDINERFYLLPVLEHEQTLLGSGESARMLKIASVTELNGNAGGQTQPSRAASSTPQPPPETAREYRAAVVFVIDSTISMGPYIKETKAAVTQVYERLREADVLDRVRFGLVAFRAETRDDTRNRDLQYVAREFVDPSEVSDSRTFLDRVEDVREAGVSTDYFDEDAFAGVVAALDDIDWNAFDARYIVLITDAGAIDGSIMQAGGKPVESTTGLDARRIASIAGEKQVAITVFHLKTPDGARNHRRAEAQYRTLAQNARFQTQAYLPINAGSVRDFRRAVDALAGAIIANVGGTQKTSSPRAAPVKTVASGTAPASTSDDPEQNVRAIANALGHAMRLRYLGTVADTRAPTLFDAWISDRDFADLTKRTVEVRVLLTKNQLSDLQMILQRILNAAEQGMLKPDTFFGTLRSIAAQFGRDPNLANDRNATRLADLGLLGEYLEGLPYQSEVMRLSQDTWTAWGSEKQVEFINTLKRKLRQYARYNEDWENWVNLAQTVDGAGDFVYPVPLEDMP